VTKDEIIRMAREADLWGEIYAMQRFAELVAEVERKACAKLFESYETFGEDYDSYYADKYKAMILARGNNDV
jgi:hypothetical protein